MKERRPSLASLLQVAHSHGLVVHSIETTPAGYRLTTAPQGAPAPAPDDDLARAREKLERAREDRRTANGH